MMPLKKKTLNKKVAVVTFLEIQCLHTVNLSRFLFIAVIGNAYQISAIKF